MMKTIYWNQTKMTKNVVHVGPVIQVRYKIGIITNAVYMQLERKNFQYMIEFTGCELHFGHVCNIRDK